MSDTPTMKVTVCGPNLRDQSKGQHHVHAADCADLKRGATREPEYRNGWTIEASSKADVVQDIYPPADFDYDPATDLDTYAGDVHFFPCCDGLPDQVVDQADYTVGLKVTYRPGSDDLHGAVSEYAETTLADTLLALPEVLSVEGGAPRPTGEGPERRGDATADLLAEHFGLAADNSHAHYLEVRQLVVQIAAHVAADRSPLVHVADRLQEFYENRMAAVIDASTGKLRMDWRDDRTVRVRQGDNLEHAPGFRAWEDSPQEAWQAIARELLATGLACMDWRAMAAELLAEEREAGTLGQFAATLRELHALEGTSEADPVAGEVPAAALAERCGLDTETLAGHLEDLRQLGLAGSRFVGGTSGTLLHTCQRAPLSPYVPDAVKLTEADQ